MKPTSGNTIGAALLGAIAASILFGMAVVQVYTYYYNFPNDWKLQKYAVALLLLSEVLYTVFTVVAIYHYVVDAFGDTNAVKYLSWSFKLQAALGVEIILLVQGLYAWRVYRLGINFSLMWPWFIIILVAAGWGVGIVIVVKTYATDGFASINELKGVIDGGFITATVIDFAIATTICYYLHTHRTSFRGTNNKLVKIIRYVLICGFLTSACSLSALITSVTMPTNLIYIGIDFLLPHLYINSYLAMLNARTSLNDDETSLNMSQSLKFQTRATKQSETTNLEGKIHQNSLSFAPFKHPNQFQDSEISETRAPHLIPIESQSTEWMHKLLKIMGVGVGDNSAEV